MTEIEIQIVVISSVTCAVVYFLLWRLFSKVGGAVQKEANKIHKEMKGDKKDE